MSAGRLRGISVEQAPGDCHRRERAAVVYCRAEPVERGKVFRHAVAHVPLEPIAGMRRAETRHQTIARHLGDDRGGGDRSHQAVAADHRLAVAAGIDAVAAIDENQARRSPATPAPRAPAPTARRAEYCRGRSATAAPSPPRPGRGRRCAHRALRAAPASAVSNRRARAARRRDRGPPRRRPPARPADPCPLRRSRRPARRRA